MKVTKPLKRTSTNLVLDAYDAQIAAAEASDCDVLRIELSAASLAQLNDAADAKEDADAYRGIPLEVDEAELVPVVVGMAPGHLRQRYVVMIRGEIDPLSPRRR